MRQTAGGTTYMDTRGAGGMRVNAAAVRDANRKTSDKPGSGK